MNTPEEFWGRFDSIVAKQGLEIGHVSESTGIPYKTITGWRYKGRYPKVEELIQIANALKVSLDYLCTGRESEPLSDEAISVEYSDKLKAIVRQLVKDDTLLDVISASIMSVERTKNIS